ncbi:NUDIX hydrolase [Candidatus Aenigmatarchaeota archaeon]
MNERQFVVSVYIVHENKVLLIKHKKLDMWLPVGGHVDQGETSDEAVLREAKEETGFDIEIIGKKEPGETKKVKMLHTPNHIQLEDIYPGHQHIDLVYFGKVISGNLKQNEDEHEDIRFFSLEELEEHDENVKYFAKKALGTKQ